jgi:hypothetical protein
MGMGQNCPKTQPISYYQGKMASEAMVGHHHKINLREVSASTLNTITHASHRPRYLCDARSLLGHFWCCAAVFSLEQRAPKPIVRVAIYCRCEAHGTVLAHPRRFSWAWVCGDVLGDRQCSVFQACASPVRRTSSYRRACYRCGRRSRGLGSDVFRLVASASRTRCGAPTGHWETVPAVAPSYLHGPESIGTWIRYLGSHNDILGRTCAHSRWR